MPIINKGGGIMKLGAVILAGGNGNRYKGKKQFELLDGKPLWKHVYDKVSPFIESSNICVVGIDVPGGETRSKSVINGLKGLDLKTERVIILESARPLITVNQIQKLLSCETPSNTFVMPLVNTVILKNGTYVNRDDYFELLTPQFFDYNLLCKAYDSGLYTNYTDETRVMYEHYQIKPFFIEGADNLIKVTYPRDIFIINEMYERMREE